MQWSLWIVATFQIGIEAPKAAQIQYYTVGSYTSNNASIVRYLINN